ncbi:hypothetical protein V2A60_002678 [Cordyceps javanica]
MASKIQEDLEFVALMEQRRRRQANEWAEVQRLSMDLSIQRCQTELGIIDPSICADIAREILDAEEDERLQMASTNIYAREVRRLTITDGQPIPGKTVDPTGRRRDMRSEFIRSSVELSASQQRRQKRLQRFINLSRVEATRVDGRQRGLMLLNDIGRMRAAKSAFDGVGHLIPCGATMIRVGEAKDYLTIHNLDYPRGCNNEDLAANFRDVKLKGQNIAIRTLKNAHDFFYGEMMRDPKEFSWSRPEPDVLMDNQEVKNQPVSERFRQFAFDASCGKGYTFAVQSHEENGEFYGIASYNNISNVSPNQFFGTRHLSEERCRMVDFNFQIISGKLPMERAVEVGTLLIEHARFYFGAQLFRSECSPLNAQYIDIMNAMGLGRFHAVEPASYNSTLAAATWKFNLWAWKGVEQDLNFSNKWFIPNTTAMQEDPDLVRRPVHPEPEEPLPKLAVVHAMPTAYEDPAAFESMRESARPFLYPHHASTQVPQHRESFERFYNGEHGFELRVFYTSGLITAARPTGYWIDG